MTAGRATFSAHAGILKAAGTPARSEYASPALAYRADKSGAALA
jgi:hypothetical protein